MLSQEFDTSSIVECWMRSDWRRTIYDHGLRWKAVGKHWQSSSKSFRCRLLWNWISCTNRSSRWLQLTTVQRRRRRFQAQVRNRDSRRVRSEEASSASVAAAQEQRDAIRFHSRQSPFVSAFVDRPQAAELRRRRAAAAKQEWWLVETGQLHLARNWAASRRKVRSSLQWLVTRRIPTRRCVDKRTIANVLAISFATSPTLVRCSFVWKFRNH